ncbi:MAG: oligosaccharide flippase family protein [Ignavibacteria bacterium]
MEPLPLPAAAVAGDAAEDDAAAAGSAGGRPSASPERARLQKAVALGAVRTGVQMAASFLSVKITSVFLGPAGIGVLAQLQGFMGLALGIMANGVNKGIVRCTAEDGDDPARRRALLSTAARALLAAGVPVALAVLLAAPLVARELLGDARFAPQVMLFAAVYVCGLFGSMLLGMANGAKDFAATTLIDTGYILSGLALFALLSPPFGVAGGLAAAALGPLALFGVAALVARRKPWFDRAAFSAAFSKPEFRRLAAFVPMAAAAAIGESFGQLVVRDALARDAGMHAVGLLQGVWRLSDLYLGIFIGMFSMYYLPRFAEIRQTRELRGEIGRALLLVLPAVAAASALLYLLRDLVIALVFTREFAPMRELFGWQMAGNVLKMAGWLFGYVLVARVAPLRIALIELAKGGAWVASAHWLVPGAGAQGAVLAYVATSAAYLAMTAGYVWVLTRQGSARR